MKSEDLFKQIVNFERKTQQLEKCDDSMSDSDWNVLADKLEKLYGTQKKLAKLASHFIKVASEQKDLDVLLPPNKKQENHATSYYANWIVDINPLVFLLMTNRDYLDVKYIAENAKSLDFYLSDEINSDMVVHPHLTIEQSNGRITGHEGRHRAAAVRAAGGKWVRIAIILKPTKRSWKPKDMPRQWRSQFNGHTWDIDSLIGAGKLRIVNDSVQKEFWREDDDDY